MRRSLIAVSAAALFACDNPLPPVTPTLCVSSVHGGGAADCTAAAALEPVQLAAGQPILVQHVLPAGVDPYGNQLQLTLQGPGLEEQRAVDYGKAAGEDVFRASAVFDFPDGGACLLVVHAQVLNSSTTVSCQVTPCP